MLLTSVETALETGSLPDGPATDCSGPEAPGDETMHDRVECEPQGLEAFARALEPSKPPRLELDEENVQAGLVRWCSQLVELIRQLLERQALRRIDAGSLSEDQIERLGVTFLRLQEQMESLKKHFNLTDDDLNLDLGPLGTTL